MKPANQIIGQVLRVGIGVLTAIMVGGVTIGFAQESVSVRATLMTGGVPVDDPSAAVWSSAPPATFPMSPQVHWQNRIQEVTVKDVIVRALHDGKQVAVLVEYTDPRRRQKKIEENQAGGQWGGSWYIWQYKFQKRIHAHHENDRLP